MERLLRLQRIENILYRAPAIQRPRFLDLENPMETFTNSQFRQRFRFDKLEVKDFIYGLIKDEFASSHGLPLPPILKLLVCLRFYACGSFRMLICDTVNISQPYIHRCIKVISRSLASLRERYVKFPSEQKARSIRGQFFQLAGFPGVTGAIDCTHVRISNPGGTDAEVYRNRKGRFTINVQAVCLPNLKFTNIVARWKGSTHDSRIFENSRLNVQLTEGVPHWGFGLSSADVYYDPIHRSKKRRWAKSHYDRYNKSHARTRNPIERAFGVLKRRFHCLGEELRTKLNTSLSVITACVILHNLAIQNGDEWDEEELMEKDEILVCDLPDDTLGKIARQKIVDQYFQ